MAVRSERALFLTAPWGGGRLEGAPDFSSVLHPVPSGGGVTSRLSRLNPWYSCISTVGRRSQIDVLLQSQQQSGPGFLQWSGDWGYVDCTEPGVYCLKPCYNVCFCDSAGIRCCCFGSGLEKLKQVPPPWLSNDDLDKIYELGAPWGACVCGCKVPMGKRPGTLRSKRFAKLRLIWSLRSKRVGLGRGKTRTGSICSPSGSAQPKARRERSQSKERGSNRPNH